MKNINYRLYFSELIFAIAVIFVHVPHPVADSFFDAVGRATVLFFFMMSGYFYTHTLNKETYTYKVTIKKVTRLLIMLASVILIYFAIFIPLDAITARPPLFSLGFNWDNIVDYFSHHLPNTAFIWFVIALIICYLLYPLIYKIKWFKESKHSIFVPLAILFAAYVFRIFAGLHPEWGFFSRSEITRNFLFTGLPCFLISSYIYHHFTAIPKMKKLSFYLLITILFGTTHLEVALHVAVHTRINEFYISSIFIAITALVFALQNPKLKLGEWTYKLLGSTGPTAVYLLHTAVISLSMPLITMFRGGIVVVILMAIIIPCIIDTIYNFFKVRVIRKRQAKQA